MEREGLPSHAAGVKSSHFFLPHIHSGEGTLSVSVSLWESIYNSLFCFKYFHSFFSLSVYVIYSTVMTQLYFETVLAGLLEISLYYRVSPYACIHST